MRRVPQPRVPLSCPSHVHIKADLCSKPLLLSTDIYQGSCRGRGALFPPWGPVPTMGLSRQRTDRLLLSQNPHSAWGEVANR